MKQLLMIYDELALKFPYHSSIIIFVKTLQKAKKQKIEITLKTIEGAFNQMVDKDDYAKEDLEEIKTFLPTLLFKNSAKKAL